MRRHAAVLALIVACGGSSTPVTSGVVTTSSSTTTTTTTTSTTSASTTTTLVETTTTTQEPPPPEPLVVDLSAIELEQVDGISVIFVFDENGQDLGTVEVPAVQVRPLGWSDPEFGSTQRDPDNDADIARLDYYLSTSAAVPGGAELVGTIDGALGEWMLWQLEGGEDGRRFKSSYASLDFSDVQIIITLTSAFDEHDHLYDSVLAPAVEVFEILLDLP